jgi:DNA-binding MarR family transcriptional regulator
MPKQQPDYGKRIVHSLRQLTQFLDTHSRQLLKLQDVTVPQVMCLDELREKGSTTVAVLAGRLHLSASTTVGIIDRLEKKRLVTRTRSSTDRRSVVVEITEKGRIFMEKTPDLLHNKLHHTLAKLSEAEQVQLANSLESLVISINESAAPLELAK